MRWAECNKLGEGPAGLGQPRVPETIKTRILSPTCEICKAGPRPRQSVRGVRLQRPAPRELPVAVCAESAEFPPSCLRAVIANATSDPPTPSHDIEQPRPGPKSAKRTCRNGLCHDGRDKRAHHRNIETRPLDLRRVALSTAQAWEAHYAFHAICGLVFMRTVRTARERHVFENVTMASTRWAHEARQGPSETQIHST
jgi:hypothetical protein